MTATDTNKSFSWLNFYNSSLGKKIITGVTGLGLTLFVLFHAIANLVILDDRNTYNQLGHWLNNLSFLYYAVELVLLAAVIFHSVVGINIRLRARRSRPDSYDRLESAGKPSKQTISSRSMAITGIILVGFLIWHLWSFKYGAYYTTVVDGVVVRDLSRLVIEKFHNPVYAFGYLALISFLGIHLRHGIWSAWQSLGVLSSSNSSFVYRLSFILAIAITLSFVTIPLTIYFGLVS